MFRKLFQAMRRGEHKRTQRFQPRLNGLETREVPAITASFSQGVLTVTGDSQDNAIVISRDAAGIISVNNGRVTTRDAKPTVANTALIQVFGLGGHDNIGLNEANGALPKANLFGGAGNDTLTGGSGADMIFGQAGNDHLFGRGGFDFLFGGADHDVLTGGDADDQVFGESGNDRFVWNPGDDTDLNEGGSGLDTVEVNGGNGAEQFTTTANGTRVRFDRLDPAPFALDIGTAETLVVNMNGGDDSFSATGNLAALIQITVDGGIGNDTLLGSNGTDLLLGGDGNDFIDGQQGADVAFLGAGNDTFQWDPGDGSDVVEGQDGLDALAFNGSAGSEIFEASSSGSRLRFTRNLGNIVMDLNELERVHLNTLGGSDTVTVGDLSGTGVAEFNIQLAGAFGGTVGDTQPDAVIINGTAGHDIIDVFGSGTSLSVVGMSTVVNILNSEGSLDSLVINALGGQDGLTASTLPAGITRLTFDGGAGEDVILGSRGDDVLLGGNDADFISGGQGNDVALLGHGDDVFQWVPGDGSDTIEGQDGKDRLQFFGSNASENFDIVANGGRVLFLRNVANVTMDLNDTEEIELRALGGADSVVIGDLSGTDVTAIAVDLRGSDGGTDEQADSVTVDATQGADLFGAAGDAGGVTVFGLQARVNLFHHDPVIDRLTLNGLGGADVIDATSLEADGPTLALNGGLGADVLLGSDGNDLAIGGDGDDLAFLGAGDDTFVWNPGDDNDTVEGQAGVDELLFQGANVAEVIGIAANGGRVLFTRNIATVTMDLDDVETITFHALGGADVITVNDLSGTDVTTVNLNLATSTGSGDAQPDSIIVNGTNGDDVAFLIGGPSGTSLFGLAATVNITGAEAISDRLTINALAGDDVIDASGLVSGAILLTADGGADDDVILGGEGDDILIGGPGDDVLIGGLGTDLLLEGEVIIQ